MSENSITYWYVVKKWSYTVKVLASIAALITSCTVIYGALSSWGVVPITLAQARSISLEQVVIAEKRIININESNYSMFRKQQDKNTLKLRALENNAVKIEERTKNIQDELKIQRGIQTEILRQLRIGR